MIDVAHLKGEARHEARTAAAHAAVKDGSGTVAVDLYERTAEYLMALADHEEAAAMLKAARAALDEAQGQHGADVRRGRELVRDGVEILALDAYDAERDPGVLRRRAGRFAQLAEAGR